jgi:hypothetical protein
MIRRTLVTLAAAAVLSASFHATPGAAQEEFASEVSKGRPWFAKVSHWGRWVALAATGTMIAIAATNNSAADNAFDTLESLCSVDPTECRLVDDGNGGLMYENPLVEEAWQSYASHQSTAQSALIAGQVTLVFAGGMFLVDLLYKDDRPKNIPYTPFEVHSTPNELGLSYRF